MRNVCTARVEGGGGAGGGGRNVAERAGLLGEKGWYPPLGAMGC